MVAIKKDCLLPFLILFSLCWIPGDAISSLIYFLKPDECDDRIVQCPCGRGGSDVLEIPIKQYKHFTLENAEFTHTCRPYEDYDPKLLCQEHENCADCSAIKNTSCSSCLQVRRNAQGSCPTVKKTTCAIPEYFPNGYANLSDSAMVNSWVTFGCNDGYRLEGDSINYCEINLQWSGEQPSRCVEDVCLVPPKPENGFIHNIKNQIKFKTGSKISYVCDDAHVMIGGKTRECLSGKWTGREPICVKVITCKDPGIPEHAKRILIKRNKGVKKNSLNNEAEVILPSGEYVENTHLVFSCNDFYELKGSKQRSCKSNGKWTGQQPICIPYCGISDITTTMLQNIVNGVNAKQKEIPWQAAIFKETFYNEFEFICGGSLISEEWVLTAAHCVTVHSTVDTYPSDYFKVFLGKYYLDLKKDNGIVKSFQVQEIFVHPDYNFQNFHSDIALIHLEKPVSFTPYIIPICLPTAKTSNLHLIPGTLGTVSGWGKIDHNRDQYANQLQKTKASVLNFKKCKSRIEMKRQSSLVTATMFCAGSKTGLTDSAEGDSGGPITFASCSGGEKRRYLEGIVSWGLDDGYGVYTKVHKFLTWIERHI